MILQRSLLYISTFVFMILLRAMNKKFFAKHSTAKDIAGIINIIVYTVKRPFRNVDDRLNV